MCLDSQQQGFSLLELLVAMIIGLMILVGVSQIYTSQASSYRWQQEKARLQEDARLASYLLSSDLLPASEVTMQNQVLTIISASSPRQQMQAWRGQSLGKWVERGNSGNFHIEDPQGSLASLQQNHCVLVDGQLFKRVSNPGQGQQQGNVNMDRVTDTSSCAAPLGTSPNYYVAGNNQLYGGGITRIVSISRTPEGELVRTDTEGKETTWLEQVLAFEIQALTKLGGYVSFEDLTSSDWDQVQALRLGLLLQSQNPLPRVASRNYRLLTDQEYACPAGHFCTSVIKTVRIRNHGR